MMTWKAARTTMKMIYLGSNNLGNDAETALREAVKGREGFKLMM